VSKGTGASQPQGFEDAATEGAVTAADDAFTSNEILNLLHSVDIEYRNSPGAGFMMHDLIAKEVRKLTVTSSADQYLWEPSFKAGQPDTLLGKPVYINNEIDSTVAADNRTIFFGDWDSLWIRIVRGIELAQTSERFIEKYQEGFIGFMRMDSELVDTSAIKFLRQLTT
jgi:HK97 family phage major capsid protein